MSKYWAFYSFQIENLREKLRVPQDDNPEYVTNRWCNRDLIPIPPSRRTFTSLGFFGYWSTSGSCVTAWTIGSTLLSYGLTARQAIISVVLGGFFTAFLAVTCGWMGRNDHIGFTVASRISYGFYGSYIMILIRAFICCIWVGIQGFWGGQATKALIGSIFPIFINGSLNELFSESSNLAKNDFIGFCIWGLFFAFFILIPPEKLQLPFMISFVLFVGTGLGLLGWSVCYTGGLGPLFDNDLKQDTKEDLGWGIMFGTTAIIGSWGAGCLGQSDWTRYAKTPNSPILSQILAAPLTITITALIGIMVTSACKPIFNELIWSPIALLPQIQKHYDSSSSSRAAIFFASLGLISTQMSIAVVLNALSTGMDISGLCPKYINIRRGSYIMAVIGIVSQPWKLLETSGKFLTVVAGFGAFIAPMTGVMLADYFVIRKRRLSIYDLYNTEDSIYWYHKGFNWRGFLACIFGIWPLMPGLIATAGEYDIDEGWIRLYRLTFIIGTVISFFMMILICKISPPPGLDKCLPFNGLEDIDLDIVMGIKNLNKC